MAVIIIVVHIKGLAGFGGIAIGGIVRLNIYFLAFISGAIPCTSSLKYAMVTDCDKETNLVVIVAVKANSVEPPYEIKYYL